MEYFTRDEALLAELREDTKKIHTVSDLSEYVRNFRSPVVGECILPAIEFFTRERLTPNGKRDWKAVKERQRIGVRFQLSDQITPDILRAIWQWLILPGYGRDIGTEFDENLLSSKMGVGMPRYVAFDILALLKERAC